MISYENVISNGLCKLYFTVLKLVIYFCFSALEYPLYRRYSQPQCSEHNSHTSFSALQPRHGNIKSSIVCLPSQDKTRLNSGVIITHHHHHHHLALAIMSNVRRQPARQPDSRPVVRHLSKHSSTATAMAEAF